MDELTKIFKALSDPNRLRIMKALEIKPLCVCEFTKALSISNSTVSTHLSVLRNAGLISLKKEGKWVYCSINTKSNSNPVNQILALLPGWINDNEDVASDKQIIELTTDSGAVCAVKN